MMELVIKIPKEFEEHFNSDRFEDSLSRVASDIESFGFQLAGRYEQETITMLRNAIKNGTPLPKGHGDLIDRSEVIKSLFDYHNGKKTIGQCIDDVQTIIEAEGSESE